MQGRIAGFFMTIFMALPLAAIPLMSIFGIPQFDSFASTADETAFLLEDPASESSAPGWDDSPAPAFNESQPTGSEAGPFDFPATGSAPVQTAGLDGPTSMPINHNQSPTGKLTWEQSLARLAEFGISEYRVQPGLQPGTTHFACYSRQSGSATVIRFEGEGATPLEAIRKTLDQVGPWFASSSSLSSF
ncbi:hypothetical protein [Rubinisphaera margarita]|uniref:hypothetical protein n=1 Tax=Rubinisphaera margarita TaxID=2909586 RepID=UPI001EE8102D|nr:hypothetical protein [Rubinisphaera margarita]MCG6154676.1 hypothetical protein [Rubinisphaera margarita]